MNASELRIGNLIYNKEGNIVYVNTNHLTLLLYGIENEFKPIPLTEEWLLKFGFKKDFNGYLLKSLSFSITRNGEFMICVEDRPTQTICYSVHHLQNLYFAIIGEELKQREQ